MDQLSFAGRCLPWKAASTNHRGIAAVGRAVPIAAGLPPPGRSRLTATAGATPVWSMVHTLCISVWVDGVMPRDGSFSNHAGWHACKARQHRAADVAGGSPYHHCLGPAPLPTITRAVTNQTDGRSSLRKAERQVQRLGRSLCRRCSAPAAACWLVVASRCRRACDGGRHAGRRPASPCPTARSPSSLSASPSSPTACSSSQQRSQPQA